MGRSREQGARSREEKSLRVFYFAIDLVDAVAAAFQCLVVIVVAVLGQGCDAAGGSEIADGFGDAGLGTPNGIATGAGAADGESWIFAYQREILVYRYVFQDEAGESIFAGAGEIDRFIGAATRFVINRSAP